MEEQEDHEFGQDEERQGGGERGVEAQAQEEHVQTFLYFSERREESMEIKGPDQNQNTSTLQQADIRPHTFPSAGALLLDLYLICYSYPIPITTHNSSPPSSGRIYILFVGRSHLLFPSEDRNLVRHHDYPL